MTFSSQKVTGTPGNIVGAVTNNSKFRYPCVDAIFSLSTHFEDRQKGLPDEQYGSQKVRIRDIKSGDTVRFSAPLVRKAGFGFSGYQLCADPVVVSDRPTTPPDRPLDEIKFCEITGRVGSQSNFEGFDDRRRREVIEKVYVLDAKTMKKVAETKLDRKEKSVRDHRIEKTYKARSFRIAGLPSKRDYVVMLDRAWRTDPERISFSCPNARGRFKFGVDLLFHTGNRLGG